MSKNYIVYGDYEMRDCCFREDYKVLGFVEASSPDEAIKAWLTEEEEVAGMGLQDTLGLLEDEILVREVGEDVSYYYLSYLSRWKK